MAATTSGLATARLSAPERVRALTARLAVAQWLAVLALVVGAGWLWHGTAAGQDDADLDDADADRGAELYARNCAQCHGPAGTGGTLSDGREVPALVDRERVTIAYTRLVLDTGRMPPGGDPFDNRARDPWPPQDRRDVLAFMIEEFELDGDVDAPPVGAPQRGLEVYAANCANCHGAAATGGNAGGDAWTPTLRGFGPQTIADAVRTGPFEMPRFSETYLDDEDVGAVAGFLEALEDEQFAFTVGTEVDPATTGSIIVLIAGGAVIIAYIVGSKPRRFDRPPATDGDDGDRDE